MTPVDQLLHVRENMGCRVVLKLELRQHPLF